MTEAFPGRYIAGDYQEEQKTPETEYPADGKSQEGSLLAVDPEALREGRDKLLGDMGSSALEASGVASPEGDTSQDSSDPPKTLSPAEALRARLA